ncbi:hypothetical protein JCM3765_006716 [Sporobolomyces pararoseus]
MSASAADTAFGVADILENILEHIYTIGLEEENLSLLIPATLVSRVWTAPAQALLHRRLVFRSDDGRLKKWLQSIEGGGPDTLSKFVSIAVHIESDRAIEEDSEEYGLIVRMMKKVRGVEMLVLGLTRQTTIPSDWLLEKNLSSSELIHSSLPDPDLSKLVRSSLSSFLKIIDFQFQDSRDWNATFKNLARWKGAGSSPVRRIELQAVTDYTRYLGPQIPLPKDPRSIRGSIFPFASHLLTLSLPYLLPSDEIHNLAILGAACRSLETLNFDEISTHSTSSIPILRFFPTLKMLSIGLLVGLPHAPSLHPRQVELLASCGRGDVVLELAKLFAMEELHSFEGLMIRQAKFFYDEQCAPFIESLQRRGGTLGLPQPMQLTPEETHEAHLLLQNAVTLRQFDAAKKQIAHVQVETKVGAQEGDVNGSDTGPSRSELE